MKHDVSQGANNFNMPRSFGPPKNHIPGRDYTTAIRGEKLTDAKILRYILAGHYGEERRLAAIANLPKKRTKAPKKTKPPEPTVSNALKYLKKLSSHAQD